MTLTDEQLLQIQEYAANFMSATDTALLIGLNETETKQFIETVKNHKHSPVYKAFHKGRVQNKYELRKKVIYLAKMGSQTAQALAEKYFNEKIY